ncbi:hypothetical protein BLOT_000104 [Blomia tropicalis]|nr:hypothetical protein BLOT_000104 [Blomia tropicalis]
MSTLIKWLTNYCEFLYNFSKKNNNTCKMFIDLERSHKELRKNGIKTDQRPSTNCGDIFS